MAITLTRLDDYQSWLLDTGASRILIDPWLDDEPIAPEAGGFHRAHREPPVRLADVGTVDAVVLSAAVNDHVRAATLRQLPAAVAIAVPGHTVRYAQRMVADVEFTAVEAWQSVVIAPDVRLTGVPTRRPLAYVAGGWVLDIGDPASSTTLRVWLDPHQPDVGLARRICRTGRVDVMVASTERVCFDGLAVTSGPRKVANAARAAGAAMIVPSAVDPLRDLNDDELSHYRVTGGLAALAASFDGRIAVAAQGAPIVLSRVVDVG